MPDPLPRNSFQTRFPSIYGPENATLLGATLSFFVLGAFFGCIANIFIGNKFGRRTVLIAGGVGTLIGGSLQAGSINLAMLMISRLINGFAVGQLTATVPPYVGTWTGFPSFPSDPDASFQPSLLSRASAVL